MSVLGKRRSGNIGAGKVVRRALVGICMFLILGACSSQRAREADLAAAEAAGVATQQESARLEAEQARQQARQQAAEQQRQREMRAAEIAREQIERLAAIARAEEEAAQRRQAAAEAAEQARLAEIAAAEAGRQEKLDRITELERQIATVQADAGNDEAVRQILQEAIEVAEELLEVLTAEQAKYENTDADGIPLEPLAKDLIAELEQRKDDLVRQASLR
ncbi:MAG: hypothetical protein IIC10_00635 [Proteobacteria bacterium]|nr:hypothetical protein [Pseudomonadota bacterium]